VVLDCRDLPQDVVESMDSRTQALAQLFRCVPGALPGVDEDRLGRVQLADGGTLYVLEVTHLPLPLQSSLQRALESGSVRRLGDTVDRPLRVRAILATSEDSQTAAAEGRLRPELRKLVSGATIAMPSLKSDYRAAKRAFEIRFLFPAPAASRRQHGGHGAGHRHAPGVAAAENRQARDQGVNLVGLTDTERRGCRRLQSHFRQRHGHARDLGLVEIRRCQTAVLIWACPLSNGFGLIRLACGCSPLSQIRARPFRPALYRGATRPDERVYVTAIRSIRR